MLQVRPVLGQATAAGWQIVQQVKGFTSFGARSISLRASQALRTAYLEALPN